MTPEQRQQRSERAKAWWTPERRKAASAASKAAQPRIRMDRAYWQAIGEGWPMSPWPRWQVRFNHPPSYEAGTREWMLTQARGWAELERAQKAVRREKTHDTGVSGTVGPKS